jgi:predicted HD superfamily hydrolase involved in NAD metabolism
MFNLNILTRLFLIGGKMFEKLRCEVQKRVTPKRYTHILGVEEKAVELGKRYQADENKLRIAAILHDVAKSMQVDELEKICRENFSAELTEEDLKITEILHGFVGSIIARKEFGIDDTEILDAIKYHTIGKKGLSIVGRIIYIADGIEKNRDYPGVEYLREMTNKDLNQGIICEIDHKAEYLKSVGGKLHKNTLEMKNWLEQLKVGGTR